MKIEVLGAGCAKCNQLYEAAREAALRAGVEAPVEKVEELAQILRRGVLITPALVVDGKVVASGRVPSVDEIASLLKA